MATAIETRFPEATEALKDVLSEIEENVVTGYTLADAIREGSTVTDQEHNWGSGTRACALSAGAISVTARVKAGHL